LWVLIRLFRRRRPGFSITPLPVFLSQSPPSGWPCPQGQRTRLWRRRFRRMLVHLKRKTVICAMGSVLAGEAVWVGDCGWCARSLTTINRLGPGRSAGKPFATSFPWDHRGADVGFEIAERGMYKDNAPEKRPRAKKHTWIQKTAIQDALFGLGLYISVIPPTAGRGLCRASAAIMGVGGGFNQVPAMIYLLGNATKVVFARRLFQSSLSQRLPRCLHATTTIPLNIVLAVLLLIAASIGAAVRHHPWDQASGRNSCACLFGRFWC